MRPEDSGSTAPGAAHRPGDIPGPGAARRPDDRPGDVPHHDTAGSAPHDPADGSAPDDDWPDDEAADQTAPTWPAASAGPYGQPGPRHRRPLAVTAVAVAALAVGAGGAAAVIHELPQASPPATPSAGAPAPAASGGGVFPGGGAVPGGSGSGTARLFMAGRVLAVTPTSITIGGPGHRATATVTAATKVTGQVTSIRSVKVGDQVSAQITEHARKATVIALQDPARLP
jgi:hypothetical protein